MSKMPTSSDMCYGWNKNKVTIMHQSILTCPMYSFCTGNKYIFMLVGFVLYIRSDIFGVFKIQTWQRSHIHRWCLCVQFCL